MYNSPEETDLLDLCEALKEFPIKEDGRMECTMDGDKYLFAHKKTIIYALTQALEIAKGDKGLCREN